MRGALKEIAVFSLFVAAGCASSVFGDEILPKGLIDAAGDVLAKAGVKIAVHVANNAELSSYPYGGVVTRDGYATPGDGGKATYTYSSVACSLNNGAGDGGSQVKAVNGCRVIDWASVNYTASISLFEPNAGNGTTGAPAETAAFQAALNTGYDVYLPYGTAGTYFVTAGNSATTGLLYKKAGQRLFGSNSNNILIGCALGPSPSVNLNPCLNTNGFTNTGLDGVALYYPGMPDTTGSADKTPYGPLVYAENAPGTRWRDVLLARCNVCLDLQGNSGASIFDDLKTAGLSSSVLIDGSLDTVIFNNPHNLQYYLTANQVTLFKSAGVFLNVGRMDDLQVKGGLSISHLAFNFFNDPTGFGGVSSSAGAVLGTISGFDCDTFACITMAAGNLGVSNLKNTLGQMDPGIASVGVTGGDLSISGSRFFIAENLANPIIDVEGTANVTISGGQVIYGGVFNNIAVRDGSSNTAGGQLTMTGVSFIRPVGTSGTPTQTSVPVVFAASPLIAVGNSITPAGTTSTAGGVTNNFFQTTDNAANRIIGNVANGWNQALPTGTTSGSYLAN